jgi:hypothetical protein
MSKKSDEKISWEVQTFEDEETGDLILPIPPELLERMGWREGDTLNWDQDKQGNWILSKK